MDSNSASVVSNRPTSTEPGLLRQVDAALNEVGEMDRDLNEYPLMSSLEKMSGIKKRYWALAFVLLALVFVFSGIGSNVLCELVGFLYPLYASFKSLENPNDNNVRHWLTYWVVYGLFIATESVLDRMFSWMPLYFVAKVLFLLWCFLPQYQGAGKIYEILIRPALDKHEDDVDDSADQVQEAAGSALSKIAETLRGKTDALLAILHISAACTDRTQNRALTGKSRTSGISFGQSPSPRQSSPARAPGENERTCTPHPPSEPKPERLKKDQ